MNKADFMNQVLNKNNGVIKTSEVVQAGISKTYFMEYVKKMKLERVSRGIYLSQDAWADHFYLLQLRYPQIIFSHETAAYLLDMAEQEPLLFTVTVKRGYNTASLKEQNVKAYQIKKELLELGITEVISPGGHSVRAYNAERTICDFIRNRSQIEVQEFQTVLKEYVKLKGKNLPQLVQYAKEFRVESILRQYMEVLL